ncbi:MAG: nucleotide exchange factor GrpE [Phycisphaeraceae bacterium]|nr:nucleotide exchange factor GrpE [Phycisphaeraceae bacterium]
MSAARPKPDSRTDDHNDSIEERDPTGGCGPDCGCSHGDASPESEGAAVDSIEARFERLERDLADAQQQRLRLIAEYQTSQRRALESEARARTSGAAETARQFIPVIDHLDLALGQKESMSAEKAVEGLTMLRAELVKALGKSGIEAIQPKPGDEFDPHQHEAVMRQPAKGVKSDRISVVFQPGYRLGDTVLRAAKVALAP